MNKSFTESRRQGIGGSDMASILGLDPWKQAIDVFYDKRPDLAAEHGYQKIEVSGNAVDFGQYVEQPIAKLYTKQTGRKVRNQHTTAQCKLNEILRANIDRRIVGEKRGLEIKSVNWRMAERWGDSGTDEIAEYYLPQVHHYLLTMNWPLWDVAALIGGATDFRIFTVERDKEWDTIILDAAADFWKSVKVGIPPSVDYNLKTAPATIKRVYTDIKGEVQLDTAALHLHEALQELAKKRRDYELAEGVCKSHLQELMGNAGIARIPGLKGAYVRKRTRRDGYEVQPTDYIQFSYNARAK